MFNKILVALDGSVHAAKALKIAIGLSSRCEAQLLLFHAMQMRPMRAQFEAVMVTSAARDVYNKLAQEQAEDILKEAERATSEAGLTDVKRVIRQGGAAKTLIDVVKEEHVELLVIGTRGLTGLHEITMGSVAHKVTVASPCPVLVIK